MIQTGNNQCLIVFSRNYCNETLMKHVNKNKFCHYGDVIMGAIASQITSLTIIYSTVYSDADRRKHQSSAPLAFVRGIHRWPVTSPHKRRVARKMFPFDDEIIYLFISSNLCSNDFRLHIWHLTFDISMVIKCNSESELDYLYIERSDLPAKLIDLCLFRACSGSFIKPFKPSNGIYLNRPFGIKDRTSCPRSFATRIKWLVLVDQHC